MFNSKEPSLHNIPIDLQTNVKMERKQFQKMLFITNALENGWTVKKSQDSYIFTKKHENKREKFQEDYLESFIINGMQGNM
jgi:hypothetical protein